MIIAAGVGLALSFGVYQFKTHKRQGGSVASRSSPESIKSGRASCRIEDLRLRLPVGGTAGKEWEIANYFDTNPAVSKIRDYMGSNGQDAVTYDGHAGIDFELSSFRPMDRGFPVLASADGVVEETYDHAPDRNRTCVKEKGNHVKLRHSNGFATIYEHLRRGSVLVHIGDRVAAGTPLGLVGSSGCSSFPHLHLEVQDCQERSLDVMGERLFESPPAYARSMPATVMETTIFQPSITDMASVMEPGDTDLDQVIQGREASIGVTVANMKARDMIKIEFLTPNNTLAPFVFEQSLQSFHARTHWWYNFTFDQSGRWLARISINGRIQSERPILATGHMAER